MPRGSLATNIIAFLTLTPAAFSAAVVHNGTPIGLESVGTDQPSQQRDTARLRVATKVNLVAPPLALWTSRLGSRNTLTGVSTHTGASDVTLPDIAASIASADAKICPPLAADASLAAAPAPAPTMENRGQASSFGAVPEPSSAVLLAFGAASLLRRRRN